MLTEQCQVIEQLDAAHKSKPHAFTDLNDDW